MQRATEALQEADRLLKGLVASEVADCVQRIDHVLGGVDHDEVKTVSFLLEELPATLVPCLENPFAQSLAFNRYCIQEGLSHTRGAKEYIGGSAAVAARNLVFLPAVFGDLWEEGVIDKTRLIAIANRNLTDRAFTEVATMVRHRRKEDLDDFLLSLPTDFLNAGRRGPEQALETAEANGWLDEFERVEIPADLIFAAGVEQTAEQKSTQDEPWMVAVRTLRAGLSGAAVSDDVAQALRRSPDPAALVEKFLTAHRHSGDPDPQEVAKTIFFAHAGPIQRLDADDKFLLRHFRPVKTQKRGQLFYRLLEVIEEALAERQHVPDLDARGIGEEEATVAVRAVVVDLNKDPNRFLEIGDEWLGEVTRRHLYFGSRTRKEGSAYKWFRKVGPKYFLGGHKTREETDEKDARRAAKATLPADD
jgi:hypothetical protein